MILGVIKQVFKFSTVSVALKIGTVKTAEKKRAPGILYCSLQPRCRVKENILSTSSKYFVDNITIYFLSIYM